jgi:hypothetical protein
VAVRPSQNNKVVWHTIRNRLTAFETLSVLKPAPAFRIAAPATSQEQTPISSHPNTFPTIDSVPILRMTLIALGHGDHEKAHAYLASIS